MDEKSQLKSELDYVDAIRQCRQEIAEYILQHPHQLPLLLEIALKEDSKVGSRACWILEFAFKASPSCLFPYLDRFTQGLKGVRPESSIRPLAKICELLLISYSKSGTGALLPPLTEQHKELITEACFDWLISTEKVAPKAYSMKTLLLLGAEIPWIHPELKAVLEQHYTKGSPAYQARARHVLAKLP